MFSFRIALLLLNAPPQGTLGRRKDGGTFKSSAERPNLQPEKVKLKEPSGDTNRGCPGSHLELGR